MSFKIGQQAGDYEFLELVESTATGVTYRVRNALADRQELLKVLPRELQQDPELVERFLREAKIHARLHHPNIASFYSAAHLNDELVMTSELVEGTSLEQRIASGSLPLEQAAEYLRQALAALSCAHREGVVHRDITPRRLVITPEGTVKVTGFGLAKKPTDPQLTQPGIVMGSMHYMSPEQVKGSNELDRRSDIYSLGVVLYEAVTGRKPFDSKSDFEVFMAHVNEEPPPPSQVRAGIPQEIDQIIRTAMAKQPSDRFQSAEEFRGSLGKLQGTLANPAAEPGTVESWTATAAPETAREKAAEAGEHGPEQARQAYPDFGRMPVGAATAPQTRSGGREAGGGVTEPAAAAADYGDPAGPSAGAAAELERSVAETAMSRDDTWSGGGGEASREMPVLLRSTHEMSAPSGYEASPKRQAAESWLGDDTFAGWTTKDVVAVGALTFVIVAAVFFAMLTFLNR